MKCSICLINGIAPESLTKNANAERSVAREFGGRWEENGILSIFVCSISFLLLRGRHNDFGLRSLSEWPLHPSSSSSRLTDDRTI